MNAVAVEYFDERKGFWRLGYLEKTDPHVGMGSPRRRSQGGYSRRADVGASTHEATCQLRAEPLCLAQQRQKSTNMGMQFCWIRPSPFNLQIKAQ